MKSKKRCLALLLCFMFLFFVGCTDGGPSDFVDDDTPLSVDGVKVLTKPADYNFKDAVGENYSENYYNLFAKEILDALYHIYEDDSVIVEFEDEVEVVRTKLYNDLDRENGKTFPLIVDENGKPTNPGSVEKEYYLYDSLRYTIKQINIQKDSYGQLTSQDITFNFNTQWNWTIKPNAASDKSTIFYNTNNMISADKAQIEDELTRYYENSVASQPNFSEFYVYGGEGGEVKVPPKPPLLVGNTDYWVSPFYNIKQNGDVAEDAVNYFQDALEYAVYLFVLGFDYNADAADAPYFDFEVVYDTVSTSTTYGHVTDVKVGGWGNEKISVSKGGENSALGKVKKLYKQEGKYLGITTLEDGQAREGKTNQEQIEKFIIEKIIGQDAYAKNTFEVEIFENGVKQPSLKFNRNYDKIVENIVNYACKEAPIGDGLDLNNNFLASQIVDYKGNFFGASYKDNKDDNMFQFIPAAEYQSIVIYPNQLDFSLNALKGKIQTIGDIWLAFEYWDDPRDIVTPALPEGVTKQYDKENGITINVGFRYFDHIEGKFTADEYVTKNISYGQFPQYLNADGSKNPNFEEEYENHIASFSDTGTGTDKQIGTVQIKTTFKQDIGNNAINPFVSGTEIEGSFGQAKAITIKSGIAARDYYKTNATEQGTFGALNPDKFKGEDGCDYIEIYFDIVKTKGVFGKNYNFKVALYNFLAAEDAFEE